MAEAIQSSIILTRAADDQVDGNTVATTKYAKALRQRLAPSAAPFDEADDVIYMRRAGYALVRMPGPASEFAATIPGAEDPQIANAVAVDDDRPLRRLAPMVNETAIEPRTDELPWNLQAIGIIAQTGTTPPAYEQPTGRGAKVAILDSGFDSEHPDFRPKKRSRGGSRGTQELPDEPPPVVVKPGPASLLRGDDENGHGTHVAGIIRGPKRPANAPRYGVAPNAELVVWNVTDGVLTDWNLYRGIVNAAEDGADIISISVGVAPQELHPTHSPLFEQLAQILLDDYGTIIVAAAGNESNRRQPYIGPIVHPADCPSILAVGAVNRRLEPAVSSSGGICNQRMPVLMAPGVGIFSSFLSQNGHAGHPYFALNGTSTAAPHVAGVAALWAEKGYRGRKLIRKLIETAKPLGNGSPRPNRDFGWGLVQAPQS